MRNPLRLYGVLEIAVGLGALLSLWLASWIGQLGVVAFRAFGGESPALTAIRCLLAFALVAPATVPMGGTLPAVAAGAVPTRRPGETLGLLYALNTLGAALGALLCGFVLVLWLGFQASWLLAAIADLALGLVLLAVARPRGDLAADDEAGAGDEGALATKPTVTTATASVGAPLALLAAVVFTSGAVLLALEVLWTRALVLHLASHVGTFALVLAVVLVGLAAGGLVGGWLGERFADLRPIAGAAAALAAVAAVYGLYALTELSDYLGWTVLWLPVRGYWGLTLLKAIATARIALLPSLLGGLVLPLAWRLAYDRDRLGRRVGWLTAASTAGTLVGSLGAAFVLVPWLGVGRSFALVASIELALGVALLLTARRRLVALAFAAASVAGFALLVRAAAPLSEVLLTAGIFTEGDREVKFHEDGLHGLVTVEDITLPDEQYRSLSVNGINVAGSSDDLREVQKMQAHVPLLAHPDPKSILHIGVGSGGTAYSASRHELTRIDIVELNPRVVVAAHAWLREINHGVLRAEPRINIVYGDGRTMLLATEQQYDVILSDSIHPRFAGNGMLYTRDYYELARSRLRPGGVVSQWLPLYSLPPEVFKSIIKAFVEVFPDSTLWYLPNTLNPHTIVVGARDGFRFSADTVAARLGRAEVAADLAELLQIEDAAGFLDTYLTGGDGLRRLVAGAPVHTDDRPIVEYTAGRWHSEHLNRYYHWTWHQNLRDLLAVREPWPGADRSHVGETIQGYVDHLASLLPPDATER